MLEKRRSQLMIIDVQEKLYPVTQHPGPVIERCSILLEAAYELDLPVIISEQYPRGLGPTSSRLLKYAGDAVFFKKMSFSCLRDEAIRTHIDHEHSWGRDQIVIGGMEAHVCVLQTALDLKDAGYEVYVVADAVTSRTASSRRLALARMRAAGVSVINTEMALFEWLEHAGTPEFKTLSRLIR